MITREQAINAREFHYAKSCGVKRGPRGGIKVTQIVWRRNGKTKTWKTRPDEWTIPVKNGLKTCGYLTQTHAAAYHVADDPVCPVFRFQALKDASPVDVEEVMRNEKGTIPTCVPGCKRRRPASKCDCRTRQ